jgi:hypothetical protein
MWASRRKSLSSWQLLAEPSGFREQDGEGFSEDANQGNQFVGGTQFGVEGLGGRGGDRFVDSLGSTARDQGAKLRVQCAGNSRDDGGSDLVDAGGLANFVGDVVEEFLAVVAIAKESAIESGQPGLTAEIGETGERGDCGVKPATGFENIQQRLATVHDKIQQQEARNQWRNREQRAARECVLKAAANDDADVKEAMAQDAVGERKREGQISGGGNQVEGRRRKPSVALRAKLQKRG